MFPHSPSSISFLSFRVFIHPLCLSCFSPTCPGAPCVAPQFAPEFQEVLEYNFVCCAASVSVRFVEFHFNMVTPDGGASSSEVLQLDRRSLTAAAIRRGDVKISEPIPWETELHSSPSSSQRKPPPAGGSKTNIRPEEATPPKTNATVTQRRSGEPLVDDGDEAPMSQSLRHKRASLSMREDSEVQGQPTPVHQRKRESGFTESPASSPNQMQSKKKRRSGTGTIRTVFRRLFSKRDKTSPSRYTEDKKSASPGTRQHGYHKSVSLTVCAQDL